MLPKSVLFVCFAFLSACNTIYVAPDVPKDDEHVVVVPMSEQTISTYNRSSYTPKSLPSVFFQSAGTSGTLRGAGVLPEGSLPEERRPSTLRSNVPVEPRVGPYRIGVGDVVLLATKSSRNSVEELSGLLAAQNNRRGYTVQDDGAIAIPDVGRVRLAGLTIEEAEAELFQSLVENQIDPAFSLEIAEFNSQRVSVGGAVRQPGVSSINLTPLYLDQAIAAAGGLAVRDLDFASIRLYRDGTLYQIPLQEYLDNPKMQRIRLIAGDSIYVDTEYELDKAETYFTQQLQLTSTRLAARERALEELTTEITLRRAELTEQRDNFEARIQLDGVDRDYVYLAGERSEPSRYTLPFGRQATLADALFNGNGFSSETSDPSEIYVLRAAPKKGHQERVLALHLDAEDATAFVLATKLELRPNDIVFIAEQRVTRWGRVVNQLGPGLTAAAIAAL